MATLSAEVREAEGLFNCAIHHDVSIDQLADFDAFAAQVAALDAVVSVSNTTVHMAGALGVPCIVMPPPTGGLHWYWGLEGERTPWYDSVRLIRRTRSESWEAQIERAAARLARYLETRATLVSPEDVFERIARTLLRFLGVGGRRRRRVRGRCGRRSIRRRRLRRRVRTRTEYRCAECAQRA